jgi:peroxiredoxin Q/BCP
VEVVMMGHLGRRSAPFLGVELALLLSGCVTTTASSSVDAPASVEPASDESASNTLAEGTLAPNFVAPAHDGNKVALSELRGRTVILWFYARDETPLATREATDFRSAWPELQRQGIAVVGVSTDTVEAHKDFASRLRLPFPLLSDERGSIARAYGVPVSYGIADRRTYVIGSDGTVERIYRTVDVPTHVAEVIGHIE